MGATTEPRQTVFTGPSRRTEPIEPAMFTHIVMFRMYENATEEVRDEVLRFMRAMCEDARGIVLYELAESTDTRKGVVMSELIIFTSRGAFEHFKKTPGHMQFANFIRQYADWCISDYDIP